MSITFLSRLAFALSGVVGDVGVVLYVVWVCVNSGDELVMCCDFFYGTGNNKAKKIFQYLQFSAQTTPKKNLYYTIIYQITTTMILDYQLILTCLLSSRNCRIFPPSWPGLVCYDTL